MTAVERQKLLDEYEALTRGYDEDTGARQLRVEDVDELRAAGRTIVFVDVREVNEQAVSTIENAVRVTPDSVDDLELDATADATIVTYCTAGYRSGLAAVELERRLGRPVHNLHGGIVAWWNAGRELRGPDGQAAERVHAYGPEWERFVLPRK